jgi:hypothetical protein
MLFSSIVSTGRLTGQVLLLSLLCSGEAAARQEGGGGGPAGSGHNGIWVHDASQNTDVVYNYGIFSFQQENFFLRFIQGRMLYRMEGYDAEPHLGWYVSANRSIWVQELNLTPGQRLELRDFLVWNDQPENRHYRYHYYDDNCSTRIRDAIDRVLGGRIQEQTGEKETGVTFRFHTRRLTTNDILLYTGLLIGLAQPVDRPISAWEEMFLPLKLREHLRDVTIPAPNGESVSLVKEERTLFTGTAKPLRSEPPSWMLGYLMVGGLLAGALLWLGNRAASRRGARLGFAILTATWALLVGVMGSWLVALWTVTDHTTSYGNENLFLFNPLLLPLVVLAPMVGYGSRRAAAPAVWVAAAVAAVAFVGFVAQVFPGMDQVNGELYALAMPVHGAIAVAVHRMRKRG